MSNAEISTSFNQINLILSDLCKNESHYIINLLSSNFQADIKLMQTLARDLYIVFFGESIQEDNKTTVMKWNLYLILIYILADYPYESPSNIKNESFQRFWSVPSYLFYSKLSQYDQNIAKIDLAITINKIEFLYRYSNIMPCKENAPKLRDFLTEVYGKVGSSKKNLLYYYQSLTYYMECCFDTSYEILKKINIQELEGNEQDTYLHKRYLILKAMIENQRKNTSNELVCLSMMKSPNNSTELNVRLYLNISDSLHLKADFEELYAHLTQLNWYLKTKAITGSSSMVSNYTEVSIIVKLRLAYCMVLLYDQNSGQQTSTIKELDDCFQVLSEAQEVSKVSTSNLPVLFKSKNCYYSDGYILSRLFSNLHIYYVFIKRIYGEDCSSMVLDSIIKSNQENIRILPKDVFLNIFLIRPNDSFLNRVFNERIEGYLSVVQNQITIVDVCYLYNKLISLMSSLLSDPSNKKIEYSRKIIELCNVALRFEAYDPNSIFMLNIISLIYYSCSYAYYTTGDYYSAEKLIVNTRHERIDENIRIIKLKGDIAYKKGLLHEALQYYNQAITHILNMRNQKNQSTLAVLNYNCGLIYLLNGEIPQAKLKFKGAIDSYENVEKRSLSDQENLNYIKKILVLLE